MSKINAHNEQTLQWCRNKLPTPSPLLPGRGKTRHFATTDGRAVRPYQACKLKCRLRELISCLRCVTTTHAALYADS